MFWHCVAEQSVGLTMVVYFLALVQHSKIAHRHIPYLCSVASPTKQLTTAHADILKAAKILAIVCPSC
jgi:hypothetical protein